MHLEVELETTLRRCAGRRGQGRFLQTVQAWVLATQAAAALSAGACVDKVDGLTPEEVVEGIVGAAGAD